MPACPTYMLPPFSGDEVLSIGSDHQMPTSDHEESDTRIILHVNDSLERGLRSIMIRTVDTDVVVILISQFHSVIDRFPEAKLWVAFGTGKHFRYYSINAICAHLGREQSRCLVPFHAFTGCDTTSSFFWQNQENSLGHLEHLPRSESSFYPHA